MGATLAAAKNTQVPTLDSWDLVRAFPVDGKIELYGANWTVGCTIPLERFLMGMLLRYFQPRLIVEIGTYRGASTRLILDNCTEAARVFTIDLPPNAAIEAVQAATDEALIKHRVVGADFVNHPRKSQATQIFGDTFDPKTWQQIPNGIQFAFIDGSHSYNAVRNDTEKLWPKLASDAVVIWHDYYSEATTGECGEYGVGQYLRERMSHEKDIFVCAYTAMAFRVPLPILTSALKRIPSWFPPGDYARQCPNGPAHWLQN
jgi:predicted O-methyltransferase YrrM